MVEETLLGLCEATVQLASPAVASQKKSLGRKWSPFVHTLYGAFLGESSKARKLESSKARKLESSKARKLESSKARKLESSKARKLESSKALVKKRFKFCAKQLFQILLFAYLSLKGKKRIGKLFLSFLTVSHRKVGLSVRKDLKELLRTKRGIGSPVESKDQANLTPVKGSEKAKTGNDHSTSTKEIHTPKE